MTKTKLYFLFPLITLVSCVITLSIKIFNIPPMGKFANPFIGGAKVTEQYKIEFLNRESRIMAVRDSVKIYFDERLVPHIFAKNDEDLFFTQGYVTALLRLWQIDFLSDASAGKLSEIFGESTIDIDRKQRRLGILKSAEESLKLIEQDSLTNAVLTAFTNGVNQYIESLDYKDYPFEYKLLDYKPKPWTKLKTLLIMKQVTSVLTGYEEDMSMSNLLLNLGSKEFNSLYPDYHKYIAPITQDSLVTGTKNTINGHKLSYLNSSFMNSSPLIRDNGYNPRLGSNNWAISGNKSKTGNPILANDLHLNLTLPSIWLEMQLSSPAMNTYGVTIPGIPSIVVGFNSNLAWGITNGSTDSKDWYKMKVSLDYERYELDGQYYDLDKRIEHIKVRGTKAFSDTVYYSVHGPIVEDESIQINEGAEYYALSWGLHNVSNDILAFIKLNKAETYSDYKNAIKHLSSPTLNISFINDKGDIGITHQGKIPKKWNGQGKFLLDGTNGTHLYKDYISNDSLPSLYNPASGYVFSANQHPTGTQFPYYFNGYFSETRANRIKELIEKGSFFEINDMKNMQLDNTSAFATEALPILLKLIEQKSDGVDLGKEFIVLANWDGSYVGKAARIFEMFWSNVKNYTWDELERYSFYKNPDDYILLDLIKNDPDNKYFDRLLTNKKESAGDIVYKAYINAIDKIGSLDKLEEWSIHNKVDIDHIANIKELGINNLQTLGHPDVLNAGSNNWGPTWRMVVELRKEGPRAYGIYPGGQSGNVGSPYYNNFIQDWKQGNYYNLHLFDTWNEVQNFKLKSQDQYE
jgi:penicillin G amidase